MGRTRSFGTPWPAWKILRLTFLIRITCSSSRNIKGASVWACSAWNWPVALLVLTQNASYINSLSSTISKSCVFRVSGSCCCWQPCMRLLEEPSYDLAVARESKPIHWVAPHCARQNNHQHVPFASRPSSPYAGATAVAGGTTVPKQHCKKKKKTNQHMCKNYIQRVNSCNQARFPSPNPGFKPSKSKHKTKRAK